MPCTNMKQKKSNKANCNIHEEIIKVKKPTNIRVVIQNRMNWKMFDIPVLSITNTNCNKDKGRDLGHYWANILTTRFRWIVNQFLSLFFMKFKIKKRLPSFTLPITIAIDNLWSWPILTWIDVKEVDLWPNCCTFWYKDCSWWEVSSLHGSWFA